MTASGTINHVGLSELYRIAGHERQFVDLVLRPANGSLITVKRGFTGSVRKLTTDGFVANVTVNHLDNSKICTSGRASQGQSALYATQRPRYRVAIKSQLVLNVASRFLHIRNRVVEKAVNAVLDEIVTAMARKDRVELRGFGAFYSKDRAGRIARNPKSGVKVEVPEKNVPVFRASKEIGKRLNAAPLSEETAERTSSR